jgi:hypothetical protein
MKSTTKIAATKRLLKLKPQKNTIAYSVVIELLGFPDAKKTYKIYGNTIRPVHTSGRGRFTSNMDYTKDIVSLLSCIGIETILTNDSARGGLTGNLLTITTKIK